MNKQLIIGDCLEELDKIKENSIDAIITDPPYELNFMNKGWDNAGVSFNKNTWEKCLRVLKPGGYLLAFGGSRTSHRIACAIEDAGFEIRDTIMWLYGSGFPKSMNISKGIEAKNKYGKANTIAKRKVEQNSDGKEYKIVQTNNGAMGEKKIFNRREYKPVDSAAKKWAGWGTCLKPAFEPIIVARKPFRGSLVDNILEHGVGGLNIDECRVGSEERVQFSGGSVSKSTVYNKFKQDNSHYETVTGRFPANIIHDGSEEATGGMPQTKGSQGKGFKKGDYKSSAVNTPFSRGDYVPYNDSGSASRYFYCAKASKRDRDEGLDGFKEGKTTDGNTRSNPETARTFGANSALRRNVHPTVKPTALMRYLVRLVCPKGSVILDPFMGSGSTGKAVAYENKERNAGYSFIGIEQNPEYVEIAKARIEFADIDNATGDNVE